MNDKELVSRMQHGDMQAFDELYERYKDDAYRLACLITGSRTDGEDLAQERRGSIAARPNGKRRSQSFLTQARVKAHCPPCCGRMSSAACMLHSIRWTKNAA